MSEERNLPMLRPTTMVEAMEFSKMVASSGMVPPQFKNKPNDVLVAIQMGSELGLAPVQALQNIAVINGRPSVWGDAMLSLVAGHPDCEDIIEEGDETQATCTVKRRGRTPTVRTFTMEEAKKARLWGKAGPWTQYPKRMLQMRARSWALRDSFPDALRGLIAAEEARDISVAAPIVEVKSLSAVLTEEEKGKGNE